MFIPFRALLPIPGNTVHCFSTVKRQWIEREYICIYKGQVVTRSFDKGEFILYSTDYVMTTQEEDPKQAA